MIAGPKDQHSREHTKLDIAAWSRGQFLGLNYASQVGSLYNFQRGETTFRTRPAGDGAVSLGLPSGPVRVS